MMPEVDHDSSGLLSIELVVIILTSLNKCADQVKNGLGIACAL